MDIPIPCYLLDLFPNSENWRIGNWQIARDALVAITEAQRSTFTRDFDISFISVQSTK